MFTEQQLAETIGEFLNSLTDYENEPQHVIKDGEMQLLWRQPGYTYSITINMQPDLVTSETVDLPEDDALIRDIGVYKQYLDLGKDVREWFLGLCTDINDYERAEQRPLIESYPEDRHEWIQRFVDLGLLDEEFHRSGVIGLTEAGEFVATRFLGPGHVSSISGG